MAASQDPIHLIAQATAGEIGTDFLAALVRAMHSAMDVSIAFITRGIGAPPLRARASCSWKKPGFAFPDEYDLEGTPCRLVYDGQQVTVPEQLWRQFPKEAGREGYCGIPLRDGAGVVVGHFAVMSQTPIRNPERVGDILRIFGARVEAELQRLERDQEREVLIGRLGHAVDRLTRQHQATRRANAFKTEVLGMVAHNLRNPLAVIVGRAELVEALTEKMADATAASADASVPASATSALAPAATSAATSAPTSVAASDPTSTPASTAASATQSVRQQLRKCAQVIVQSAERMTRMIADVLASTRQDATAITLDRAVIDLAMPVRVAVGLNHAAAAAKRIRIVESAHEGGRIVADEDRVIEALDNLVSNAVKYSPHGTTVTIACGIDAGSRMATVRVADEGLGLDESDLARAFQRYQTLSAQPTGGETATGLGLAIVKAIAEAHGGSIEAASPGKGKGATFTLRLPLAPETA